MRKRDKIRQLYRKLARTKPGTLAYWQVVLEIVDVANYQMIVDPRARKLVTASMETRLREHVKRARAELSRFVHRRVFPKTYMPRYYEDRRGSYVRSFARAFPRTFRFCPYEYPETRHLQSFWYQGKVRRVMMPIARSPATIMRRLVPATLPTLYLRYPSWDAIQAEIIRRASAVPHDPKRPRLSISDVAKIRNIELRRALVTVFGVQVPKSRIIAQDEWGTVYRFTNQANIVEVTCPSTGRKYFLGVPSTCLRPKDAVYWTLRLNTYEDHIVAAA